MSVSSGARGVGGDGADGPTRRRRSPSPVLLLISPSVIFMLLLFAWPMVSGILQAFQTPGGYGLENITRMVTDPQFVPAVRNTVLLIIVLLPLQFALALVMAFLLQAKPKLQGLHFYIWAVPIAVSDLAAGLVWLSIFTDRGFLNSALNHVGVGPILWLSYQKPVLEFATIICAEVWRATSLVMVIIVSGMQGIPKDYDEAASVFGAGFWDRLRYVWLPLLRPSMQVALILRTILAFQTFAVAQALTGLNFPLLVGETYRFYTQLQNPNVAAALALVVMLVSMAFAFLYLRLLRDDTNQAAR
ncbi:carbohydrate ABC transporter permease [Raineyella fluvialis]|uniref:ABC transporter permease subunit n=1 Tax=Raineyella fluvialis TaxID=2662261 RepID=A0A5Q2FHF2_9ACTN|nr:sugar ABC transporter permease [Raineyella fluvialis]QGF24553.1 ABC transporter permease subunit [Raineyella fluvialis]